MEFLYPLIAFITTGAALWAGRRLALRVGFADRPGGRKRHDNPVPPIGGLVVLPVFVIVSWAAGLQSIVPWPLVGGIGILLLMGAIDDARPLRPFVKFAIMILTASFVVIFGQMQIGNLGNLFGFGTVQLEFLSKGFTIMALVLLMNAVNMMDGVDGLAGGFCALVAFWMMVVCAGAGHWIPFAALSILLATMLGFLAFNLRAPWRKSAAVFLGDAGALCLGLLLGWFCIMLSQGNGAPLQPITVIWIIGLPVIDAFALFIARSVRGLHPFKADRRHLHHRFLDAGISPERTTAIILALIAIFALVGFVAQANGVPAVVLFAGWMAVFILHTIGIMHPKGYTLLTRVLKGLGR
ncbi:MAG: undecaprenyl/decaprenyl-phosphate alpha-N-acetylglucosaminyl 1-phosphate transferase [Micavibrio aeruginosavorus]|uniref:Undecaprenyl/decaprenyl-phosphate alpha-N-acetylglucosaminyl 1-phosphate transferase n=1 Tax=Micavibrio aeruginosavorus TaxID=349221 RepID=A0A2W5PLE4_9BACT|nr:MAG: undecaprenyl/decaprenyl-phosphate alpha-N-acetylglucosaminyl 1-phosphate transferase [Micavibrio aeruginosavorus]